MLSLPFRTFVEFGRTFLATVDLKIFINSSLKFNSLQREEKGKIVIFDKRILLWKIEMLWNAHLYILLTWILSAFLQKICHSCTRNTRGMSLSKIAYFTSLCKKMHLLSWIKRHTILYWGTVGLPAWASKIWTEKEASLDLLGAGGHGHRLPLHTMSARSRVVRNRKPRTPPPYPPWSQRS